MQVQTERVVVGWMQIEAIEQRLAVPLSVKRFEFGRIEKPIRPQRAEGDEVPNVVAACAKGHVSAGRAERTVAETETAGGLRLIQP